MHRYFICLLSLFVSTAYAESVLRIATGEEPPYTSQTLPNGGCVLNLIKDVFSNQGYKVDYVFLPWTRAILDTKMGVYDATAYWQRNEERKKYFVYPHHPVAEPKIFFYKNADDKTDYHNYDDFFGKSIVVNYGYAYGEKFWEEVSKREVNIVRVSNEPQNFEILISGRADLTLLAAKTAEVHFRDMAPELRAKIVKTSIPPINTKSYLLISKKAKNKNLLVSAFDEGLTRIMSNTEYRKIYEDQCGQFNFLPKSP